MEGLEIFIVAAMAQCCWRSVKENDLQGEKFRKEDTLFRGWSGGSGEGGGIEFELEPESSLVILLLLSELFMATARARELLLKLIDLLQMPPPLLLRG